MGDRTAHMRPAFGATFSIEPWRRLSAMRSEPEPAIDSYDNGNPRLSGFNLDGEMHGEWVFFRRDGSVLRSGAFDRGQQVGVWRTYDRAGRVVKETAFERAAR